MRLYGAMTGYGLRIEGRGLDFNNMNIFGKFTDVIKTVKEEGRNDSNIVFIKKFKHLVNLSDCQKSHFDSRKINRREVFIC